MGLAVLEERVQGVSSTVDLTHIAAGDPGGEFSITKNASFLTLSGFDRREAVVSAAAFKPEQGYLLGGNVRFIQLRTTAARKSVWEVETADPKRLLDSVRDQPNEEQAGWALDAGVILMLGRSRLAFVGRNLNGPSFAMPDDRTVRLEPQVRAGISWMKADDYAIAIDADITENASLADGKPDRRSAFGIEKWIKEGRYGIRVGVSANTAISGSPLLLTAGFSLKSKFVGGEAALISDSDGDHVSFLGGLNLRLSRGDERDKRRK
ncbi:MAG: conjugal transfer protein TraF [Candidatus Schekmanbacteria bacterium]|nr:conjugal transfer protein TraF [Candidatus Schekmanbacteria bacterium]